jgi:cathepsin D
MYGGTMLLGPVSVGDPAVEFQVNFDTGSSLFFLAGVNCRPRPGHNRYDTTKSSTAVSLDKGFEIRYRDGSAVFGTLIDDTVTIADLTVTEQTLGSAMQWVTRYETPSDGILGMPFQSQNQYNARPLFQTLMNEGQTTSAMFAFKFADEGAELTLGRLSDNLFTGGITYTRVANERLWKIAFNSLNVDGQVVLEETPCIVDSVCSKISISHYLTDVFLQGTGQIVGDPTSVGRFYSHIPGASYSGRGFWTYPCNAPIPSISFYIAGREFPLTKFNIARRYSGSNRCIGVIMQAPENIPHWILGQDFMSGYYTVFDVGNAQVGFATLA